MRTPDDEYSPEDAARRRDAVLKIMVNTPPQPRATQSPARSKKQKSIGEDRAKARPSAHRGKP
jgi:hypothetical protein